MATPATPVDNPYGLAQLWAQGDFVAKGTLILLVIMSALSWWVMITKAWDQRRIRSQWKQAERDFWSAGSLKQAIESLKGKNNAFRAIADDGMRAAQHHEGRLTDQVDLHDWISQSLQRSLDQITNYLQGGLPILATVGSTAPFVGLFGTVWGIYHALISIGIAGQASIDKVAGPVGEALIMTAIGLAVAVPAVLGYNWLVRRNKVAMDQVRGFGADLHAVLLSTARTPARA
jgi:biopolymer transport protein ExbB